MPQPPRDTSAQVQRARESKAAQSTPFSQNVSDRLLETLIANMRALGKEPTPQALDDYTKNPYYKPGYDLDTRMAEKDEAAGEPREGFLMPADSSQDNSDDNGFKVYSGTPDNLGLLLMRRYLQR